MLWMRNYLKTGKSSKKSVMMVRLFIRSPTKLSDAFKMSEGATRIRTTTALLTQFCVRVGSKIIVIKDPYNIITQHDDIERMNIRSRYVTRNWNLLAKKSNRVRANVEKCIWMWYRYWSIKNFSNHPISKADPYFFELSTRRHSL